LDVVVHIRLTPEDKARLEKEAEEQERSQNAVMRIALRRYFKELEGAKA